MAAQHLLSSVAEKDIAEIVSFVASENLDAALELVDRFTEVFVMLSANPEMGERFEHSRQGLRRFSVGNYVVIYQPYPDGLLVCEYFTVHAVLKTSCNKTMAASRRRIVYSLASR